MNQKRNAKMKKKLTYFVGVAALVGSLTACNSIDDVVGNDNGTGGKATGYMAVQILSNNSGTRTATSASDFNQNDEGENKISNVVFYLYDASGNLITKGKTVNQVTNADDSDGDLDANDAAVYQAVVAFQTKSQAEALKIKKVLAVANFSTADTTAISSCKTLSEAAGKLTDKLWQSTENNDTSQFVMTSSTYVENGDMKFAADVNETNIKSTEDAAKNDPNPVDIHVERLAAKVLVKNNITSATISQVIDEGSSTSNLAVEILGWGISGTEPTSFLVKKVSPLYGFSENFWLNGSTQSTSGAWNEPDNFRCYWAESPNYANPVPKHGYVDGNSTLNYLKYSDVYDATNGGKKPFCTYVPERTWSYSDGTAPNYKQASTSLLVVAHVGVTDNSSTTYKDLVKFDGKLYTLDSYKAEVLKQSGVGVYYAKTTSDGTDTYTQIATTDVEVPSDAKVTTSTKTDAATTQLVDGQVACQLTSDAKSKKWVKLTGKDENNKNVYVDVTDAAEVDSVLSTEVLRGEGYKDGLMYYWVPIKHLVNRSADDKTFEKPKALGEYGVVRNHIYTIELDEVSGLGHAIWNPDEHIVPSEDTEYYLAAKMYVLSWRIVPTQKVSLK